MSQPSTVKLSTTVFGLLGLGNRKCVKLSKSTVEMKWYEMNVSILAQYCHHLWFPTQIFSPTFSQVKQLFGAVFLWCNCRCKLKPAQLQNRVSESELHGFRTTGNGNFCVLANLRRRTPLFSSSCFFWHLKNTSIHESFFWMRFGQPSLWFYVFAVEKDIKTQRM